MKKSDKIHGDISPGNIMMDKEGNVKFIDFSRSPSNKETRFYSQNHTDTQGMGRVLFGLKYAQCIKSYITSIHSRLENKDINERLLNLPLNNTFGILFRGRFNMEKRKKRMIL